MKARVKETGGNIEVISKQVTSISGHETIKYIDQKTGVSYFEEELCFPKDLTNDHGYWTRLEHTYAGIAMQGLVTRGKVLGSSVQEIARDIAEISCEIAHALVEKMKEE